MLIVPLTPNVMVSVVAGTGGYQGGAVAGNVALAVLDTTDPLHPQVLGTLLVTAETAAWAQTAALGA